MNKGNENTAGMVRTKLRIGTRIKSGISVFISVAFTVGGACTYINHCPTYESHYDRYQPQTARAAKLNMVKNGAAVKRSKSGIHNNR
jgi:hypothetical protein